MLCGKKKPLTTSIMSMESSVDDTLSRTDMDDSGHVDEDDALFDGIENLSGLQFFDNKMEHLTLLMKRAKKGFGFTVTGAKPVIVGRIEEGSPAQSAGLRKDDQIIRINGQNVTALDNEKVAKVVKSCDKQVIMDVHRRNTCNQGVSTDARFLDLDDTFSESSFSSSGFGSGNGGKQQKMVPYERMPKVSPWELYHKLKENQAAFDNDDHESEYSYYTESESCYSCYTCYTAETESSGYSDPQSRSPPNKVCRVEDNPAFDKENMAPKLPPKTFKKTGLSVVSASAPNPPARTQITTARTAVTKQQQGTTAVVAVTKLTLRYHELTESEVLRQKSLHHLFSCEVNYLRELKQGIRAFHTPLKHNIVTPQQHAILFQNIEKLCALSELLVKKISETRVSYSDILSSSEQYIDSVGGIYSSMLEDLCESYELYCSGVCDSVKMLNELRSYKDFNKYIKNVSADNNNLNLGKFIQKPVQHVKDMTLKIAEVFKNTPTEHADSEDLQEMLNALRRASTNITQEYVRRSRTNLTNITAPSQSSQSQYSYASSSVSSNNKSVASSVDSEVVDIQNRLLFGDNMKSFQLANTTRHVIYAGELLQSCGDAWRNVHAILMNDLVLLTRQQPDNFLTVLDTPILLQDVSLCTSGDKHPSEIDLTVSTQQCESLGMEPTMYKFRAKSLEQKCVWKNLLDQRIASCRSKRELTVSKVAELV